MCIRREKNMRLRTQSKYKQQLSVQWGQRQIHFSGGTFIHLFSKFRLLLLQSAFSLSALPYTYKKHEDNRKNRQHKEICRLLGIASAEKTIYSPFCMPAWLKVYSQYRVNSTVNCQLFKLMEDFTMNIKCYTIT